MRDRDTRSETCAQSPIIFDRQLLRGAGGARAALGPSTFLIERVAEDIAERLAAVLRRFELARRSRHARRRGAARARGERQGRHGRRGQSACAALRDGPLAVAADEEALPFRDGSLDLVVSALSLQFVNDLPGALVQIRRALRAGRAVPRGARSAATR